MSEAARPTPDPAIAELTEAGFQQWRHSPVTRGFLRFLADQAREYEGGIVDLWASGQLSAPNPAPNLNPDMLRGRYLALTEIADLDVGTIKQFYGIDEQSEGEAK